MHDNPMDKAPRLGVMTFNVLVARRVNVFRPWPRRREAAADVIRAAGADLIALQEPRKGQLDFLAERLGEYDWFGAGRWDGRDGGEFNPIFYRRDRLERLDGDTFWLSSTPQKPSRAWHTRYRRICTWAKFRDGRDEFFHFNTHFDALCPRARTMSARLLLKRIESIAGGAPTVVTGDLNATPRCRPYRILTGRERVDGVELALHDARDVSDREHRGPDGTFRGFRAAHNARRRLDYVMVTPGVRVLRHETFLGPDPTARPFPSDHLPVLADVALG